MILNLLLLFMAINLAFSLMYVEGTPFYSNSTLLNDCYYRDNTRPNIDPIINNTGLNNQNINNTGDFTDELITPTNSTTSGGGWGDGNPFNSFIDSTLQIVKTLDVMKNLITGGYIVNTIENFSISCEILPNGTIVQNEEAEIWSVFKDGVSLIIGVLVIFTIFYLVTGRGFALTS